jgi:hypothetical protein
MCEKPPEVVLVTNRSGDWVGIYVKGKLLDQGHSLSPWMILGALGIEFDQREISMDPYKMSSLPETLEELPDAACSSH